MKGAEDLSFGEKLQKLRKAQGLSQEELAARLSVTRQTISKWELDRFLSLRRGGGGGAGGADLPVQKGTQAEKVTAGN